MIVTLNRTNSGAALQINSGSGFGPTDLTVINNEDLFPRGQTVRHNDILILGRNGSGAYKFLSHISDGQSEPLDSLNKITIDSESFNRAA